MQKPAYPVKTGALVAGSLASIFSTVALVRAGGRRGRPVAPLNAISHWCWGDSALHRTEVDVPHTALGYLIHHGASVFWSALLMLGLEKAGKPPTVPTLAVASAATSAVACVVDFKLTPHRFTPGFEHELDKRSIAGVYLAFAAGMALGAWVVTNAGSPEGSARPDRPKGG